MCGSFTLFDHTIPLLIQMQQSLSGFIDVLSVEWFFVSNKKKRETEERGPIMHPKGGKKDLPYTCLLRQEVGFPHRTNGAETPENCVGKKSKGNLIFYLA